MVEELKLAVKVDDDIIEQSLLKQFNNAEKLADKVVFTFKNVNLDNKEIEKQFKDMQKLAGKNPIELPIDTDKSLKMLQALGDEFTRIISIAKGNVELFDNSSAKQQIAELKKTIDDLQYQMSKMYNDNELCDAWSNGFSAGREEAKSFNAELDRCDEILKRLISSVNNYETAFNNSLGNSISGKNINLVDNEGFQTLVKEVENVKNEINNLKFAFEDLERNTGSTGIFADKIYDELRDVSNIVTTLTSDILELQKVLGKTPVETNISSPIKDTFQGGKIQEATTSARELDKILEGVEIPKEAFDDALSQLDLTKSKLKEIVRITKDWNNGAESFTLKDKYGSTEIYGRNSNTEKGQLLRSHYVQYDARQAEKEAKELLAVEKEITKEIERQDKAQTKTQQKKWQSFQREQQKYNNEQKKTTNIERNKSAYQELLDTIKRYSEVSKRIAKNETLEGDLELAQKLEDKISSLQKKPILSSSQVAKSERELVNLYDQLETLEKKTAQKQNNQASAQSAKEHAEAWEKNLKAIQEYMDANTKLNNLMAKDKGTGKHASNIARQEKEVEKLKEAAIEARAALSSMVNPHEAPIDDWSKWVKAMEKFEQATKGSAESVAKLEDALRSARDTQLSSLDSVINDGQFKFDEFSARKAQSDAYKNSLKELGEKLEQLRTLKTSLSNTRAFTETEQQQINTLTQSVRTYIKEISRMSADEKGSNDISRFKLLDRIAEYMKKNTRMSREFKAELESLMDTLRTGGANIQTGDILTQFEKIKDRIRQAKQEGISFFDIFKNKAVYGFAARLAQYYLSFYDFIRYARYAVNAVIELDTALVDLQKTTTMNTNQLEDFYYASNDVAKQMGVTTAEIINQASAWSRFRNRPPIW